MHAKRAQWIEQVKMLCIHITEAEREIQRLQPGTTFDDSPAIWLSK